MGCTCKPKNGNEIWMLRNDSISFGTGSNGAGTTFQCVAFVVIDSVSKTLKPNLLMKIWRAWRAPIEKCELKAGLFWATLNKKRFSVFSRKSVSMRRKRNTSRITSGRKRKLRGCARTIRDGCFLHFWQKNFVDSDVSSALNLDKAIFSC